MQTCSIINLYTTNRVYLHYHFTTKQGGQKLKLSLNINISLFFMKFYLRKQNIDIIPPPLNNKFCTLSTNV